MKRDGSHYLVTPVFNTGPFSYVDGSHKILMIYVESGHVWTTFSRAATDETRLYRTSNRKIAYKTLEGVPLSMLPKEVVSSIASLAAKSDVFTVDIIEKFKFSPDSRVDSPNDRWRMCRAYSTLMDQFFRDDTGYDDPKYDTHARTVIPGVGFRLTKYWYGVVIPQTLFDSMLDSYEFNQFEREEYSHE